MLKATVVILKQHGLLLQLHVYITLFNLDGENLMYLHLCHDIKWMSFTLRLQITS